MGEFYRYGAIYLIVGLTVVVVAVLGIIFARRSSGQPLDRAPTPAPSLAPQLQGEVRTMLARNAKIEAIKHVRAATGLGLKDAKDAVEAIEQKSTVETAALVATIVS